MTLFLSWLVIPSYVVINNDEDTKILKQALVCILEDHSKNRIETMQALQIHTVSLQRFWSFVFCLHQIQFQNVIIIEIFRHFISLDWYCKGNIQGDKRQCKKHVRKGEYFVRKSLFLYLLFIVSTELPTVNPMTNKLDI